jgi:inosine triphosphate pyrophosphatase
VITFVTGNLLKLKEAQHILDSTCSVPFELVAYGELDLDELQSDIPEKIAAAKCRLAAKAVGWPVMIDDTSLCFNALGGLPGPYIKWYDLNALYVSVLQCMH